MVAAHGKIRRWCIRRGTRPPGGRRSRVTHRPGTGTGRPGPGPAGVDYQPGNDVVPLLLKAAKRLEPVDAAEARLTYLDAFSAAIFAGRLAKPGGDFGRWRRVAAGAPPPLTPGPTDLLLAGLVATSTGEYADGVPMSRAAITEFGNGMSVRDGDGQASGASLVRHADGGPEVSRPLPVAAWRLVLRPAWSAGVTEGTVEELRWLWLMSVAAIRVWDDDHWNALSTRHIELAREIGALSELPLALLSRSYSLLFAGALSAAAGLREETQAVSAAIGSHLAPYGPLGLAALRGDEPETLASRGSHHRRCEPAGRRRWHHLRRVGKGSPT